MSGAQTAIFVSGCVADIAMVPLTLALKVGGDTLECIRLAVATFSVLGLAMRVVLLRRGTAPARAWAEALAPTRFGAMMTFGAVALAFVMLPLVAHFG